MLYIVNTCEEIHSIFLIWGRPLYKKFSSSIFRTPAFVFMGSVHITMKEYKIIFTLLSTKLTLIEKARLIEKQ